MASPLMARLPRELWHNAGRYIGVFAMMVLSISFVSAFLVAATSIEKIVSAAPQTYNIEHARVTCAWPATDDALDAVRALGAEPYELFCKDATLDASDLRGASASASSDADADDEITLRLYVDRTQVDVPDYFEGVAPQTATEVAIDRTFCASNNLALGDTVQLSGRTYTICGICMLPDYMALFKNQSDFMMDTFTFGVGVLTRAGYDALDAQETYSYALKFDSEGTSNAQAATATQAADADSLTLAQRTTLESDVATELAKHGAQVTSIIDWEVNNTISYAADDIEGDQLIYKALLLILIVLMAFVFAVQNAQTIEQESAIIGTLMASGYKKSQILAHYMTLPVIVGIVAVVIGNALGYTALSEPMRNLYYDSYSLPPYEATFNLEAFVLTSIIPFILLVAINLVGLARKLRSRPLEFLRHETTQKSRRRAIVFPEKWPFSLRFRLRIITQNLPNFLTLFVGIWFANLLLMFGLGMLPMIDAYAQNLKETLPAEHLYTLKAAVPLDENANSAEAIGGAEQLAAYTLQYTRPSGSEEEVTVYGIEPDSAYFAAFDDAAWDAEGSSSAADADGAGDAFATPVNGIALGQGFADKFGLSAGARIVMNDKYTGSTYHFEVISITGGTADMNFYMPLDSFRSLFDKPAGYFNAYASDQELSIDEAYITNEMTPSEMDKISRQMTDSMGSVVYMLAVIAALIFAVFVYLLTRSAIGRNSQSIAYMKIFGYSSPEVKRLYLRPITYVVLFSIMATLPLVTELLKVVVKAVFMEYSGNFELAVTPELYVQVVAAGVVCYAIVALLHMRRISRISAATALKVQE